MFVFHRDKPLAMYVFSNDSQYGQDFINQTSSGGFCFNDTLMQAASIDMSDRQIVVSGSDKC